MTEAEWLASTNPEVTFLPNPPFRLHRMLEYLRDSRKLDKTRCGRRKLRLFACACYRRYWQALAAPARAAVEVAERFADGKATRRERWDAQRRMAPTDVGCLVVDTVDWVAAIHAPMVCYRLFCQTPRAAHECWGEEFRQAALVHDIFRNPFRPVAFEPAWAQPTAVAVAQAIYDGRCFEDMPILADALEDGGCNDADVLAHCRGAGPHVRGCWALDALLGKE
jgi:hypothetical protein